jgi:erythromycin esterase-like protein
MENINEQFKRLFFELDLTDDQAAMIKKLQRDVDAALRQPHVVWRSEQLAVLAEWLKDHYSIEIPDRVIEEYNRYNG